MTGDGDRLRVAMVSRRVHPAHGPGGLERHVFDLVTELVTAGVAVDLVTETPRDPTRQAQATAEWPPDIAVHWVSRGWLPLGRYPGTVVLDRSSNYFIWASRAAGRVRALSSQIQLVHAHGLAGWGVARDRRTGDLLHPLVATMQGLEEFRSPSPLKHALYVPFRRGIRTVVRHSTQVITTDESLRPVVARHLDVPPSAQTVIPNAVRVERCRALADVARGRRLLADHGLDGATPLFLSVGRLEANKGFEVLVQALASVADQLPPRWAWLLVGDGPRRARIVAAIARAGLGSKCRVHGRAVDADLHSLYAVADWFVHPTLYEGSSLVTLEAMAHGLPVVASRTGGLPDKVVEGTTGFLVTPGRVEELARQLVAAQVLDGKALGAAGRERCEGRFSWRVVAAQYQHLYRDLIQSARAGP